MRGAAAWVLAAVLAVLIAAFWAALLIYLAAVWFLTVPLWLLSTAIGAIGCFLLARRQRRALPFGVAVLAAVPITVAVVLAVFAYYAQT